MSPEGGCHFIITTSPWLGLITSGIGGNEPALGTTSWTADTHSEAEQLSFICLPSSCCWHAHRFSGATKSESTLISILANGSFSVAFIRLAARCNLGESSTISLFSGVARRILLSSFCWSFENGTLNLFFCFGILSLPSLRDSVALDFSWSLFTSSSAQNEVSAELSRHCKGISALLLFRIPFLMIGALIILPAPLFDSSSFGCDSFPLSSLALYKVSLNVNSGISLRVGEAGFDSCVRDRGRLKNFLWLFLSWSMVQFSADKASLKQFSCGISSECFLFAIKLSCDTVFRLGIFLPLPCARNSLIICLESSSPRSNLARSAIEATISRGFTEWPFSFLNLFARDLTSFFASMSDRRRLRVSLSATSHLRGSFFSRLESSAAAKKRNDSTFRVFFFKC